MLKTFLATFVLLTGLSADSFGVRVVHTPPSLALVPSGMPSDLGEINTGVTARTQIRVVNLGSKPFQLVPPPLPEVRSVRVLYPVDLVLPPGAGVNLGVEIDARSYVGATAVKAQVYTNDPGARTLEAPLTFTAIPTSEARPYGDSFRAILSEAMPEKVIPVEFIPMKASGAFVSAYVEDPAAPIFLTFRCVPESGRIIGTVALDPVRFQKALPGPGSVRIVADTANGHQNFVTIHWLFEK